MNDVPAYWRTKSRIIGQAKKNHRIHTRMRPMVKRFQVSERQITVIRFMTISGWPVEPFRLLPFSKGVLTVVGTRFGGVPQIEIKNALYR